MLACACQPGFETGSGTSTPGAGTSAPPPYFDESVREDATFTYRNGMRGDLHFAEMMGGGVAMLDFDGDGDLDLYYRQGKGRDRLYRNELQLGDGLAFTDMMVTADPEIPVSAGYGMGVATGDYDGDGDLDLYLTDFGPNRMLANRGDGTFEDVTDRTGTGELRWSVPAVFFDYDRDGWLDLYVGNYVDLSPGTRKTCRSETGARDYCGPSAFSGEPDRLFRNRGDGTFEDVTARAGLVASAGPALGAVATDFDGDGWPDLYVGNDGAPNSLFHNRGDGSFEDVALAAGCAVNADGLPEATMGIEAADFDGDGDEDLFLAHLTRETNTLLRNEEGRLCLDASVASGLAAPSVDATAFGAAAVDIDNDGWPDLVAANGAVKLIEGQVRRGERYPLKQHNQLFLNRGDGGFEEVTGKAGRAFAREEVSRGLARGDLDNDGDEDLVVVNSEGSSRMLLSRASAAGAWIGLRLVGTASSGGGAVRDMLGARVGLFRAGAPALWRTVRTAVSYASASDPRVLFGLGGPPGDAPDIESVLVLWPDGRRETWAGLEPNRYHTLRQGEGTPPEETPSP